MLKMSFFSSFSKAQEQSLYYLKLPLFKLKLKIDTSYSKTRSWISPLWLLAIEKPNFMNAAMLVSALSSLIMGFSYYRDHYYISQVIRYQKKLRDFFCFFGFFFFLASFYFNLEFCFNLLFFREIIAGFDINESYKYIQHVIQLCHMLITRFCRIIITYS